MRKSLRNLYVKFVFTPVLGFFGFCLAASFAILFYPMKWMYSPAEFDLILFRLNETAHLFKPAKDLKNLFDVDGVK